MQRNKYLPNSLVCNSTGDDDGESENRHDVGAEHSVLSCLVFTRFVQPCLITPDKFGLELDGMYIVLECSI